MRSMQLHTARHKRTDAWQSGQWLCGRRWQRGLDAAWTSPRRRLNVLQSGVADVLAGVGVREWWKMLCGRKDFPGRKTTHDG